MQQLLVLTLLLQFIHTDCDGEDKEEGEEWRGRKEAERWERKKGGSANRQAGSGRKQGAGRREGSETKRLSSRNIRVGVAEGRSQML